jgi:hypothetical protein
MAFIFSVEKAKQKTHEIGLQAQVGMFASAE